MHSGPQRTAGGPLRPIAADSATLRSRWFLPRTRSQSPQLAPRTLMANRNLRPCVAFSSVLVFASVRLWGLASPSTRSGKYKVRIHKNRITIRIVHMMTNSMFPRLPSADIAMAFGEVNEFIFFPNCTMWFCASRMQLSSRFFL